ncbi:MAG TPA: flagellin biosynthesis protein FlgH [Desulfobacteraceae bacterium]|nr:flagellin biosynthesis protein FlgH [Desulfobacteraceae bacterium]
MFGMLKNNCGIRMLPVMLMLAGYLTGCTTTQGPFVPVVPQGISEQPAVQPDYSVARPAEGSLWTAENRFLFDDTKAAYVGDTVVVDIVENSSSNMEVNSETGRTTAMSVGTPTINIMGYKTALSGVEGGNLISTSFENSTKGEAESDRLGQVTASIAARVTEVLPNGNLSIFGRRAMKVDQEVQYIVVSGIIRPDDIDSDNRVQSTSLADARIEYYGKGSLADKQKPGWGTRLIDNVWPW